MLRPSSEVDIWRATSICISRSPWSPTYCTPPPSAITKGGLPLLKPANRYWPLPLSLLATPTSCSRLLWMAVASEPRSASERPPPPACTTSVFTCCRIDVTESSAFSSVDSASAARWRLVANWAPSASVWLTPSARAAPTGSSPADKNLELVASCCWTLNSFCCCRPIDCRLCSKKDWVLMRIAGPEICAWGVELSC